METLAGGSLFLSMMMSDFSLLSFLPSFSAFLGMFIRLYSVVSWVVFFFFTFSVYCSR